MLMLFCQIRWKFHNLLILFSWTDSKKFSKTLSLRIRINRTTTHLNFNYQFLFLETFAYVSLHSRILSQAVVSSKSSCQIFPTAESSVIRYSLRDTRNSRKIRSETNVISIPPRHPNSLAKFTDETVGHQLFVNLVFHSNQGQSMQLLGDTEIYSERKCTQSCIWALDNSEITIHRRHQTFYRIILKARPCIKNTITLA